jgi:hypothetical protein
VHRRAPRRGSVPLLVVSIAVGLLFVVMIVDFAFPPSHVQTQGEPLAGAPSLPSNLTAAPTQVLAPAGTSLSFAPGTFNDVVFGLAMGADVSGTFAANAGVRAYLLAPGAFEAMETGQPVSSAFWSSGTVGSAGIALAVPAGTWYLLFTGGSVSSPTTVELTTALLAVYPPPGAAPIA